MTWTRFFDMSSGGRKKESFQILYIEAPYQKAIGVFIGRYGHDPLRTTCQCCGEDYSVEEDESFEEASRFDRMRGYWGGIDPGLSLEDFLNHDLVEVINAEDIQNRSDNDS